jgi:hypothetical protein
MHVFDSVRSEGGVSPPAFCRFLVSPAPGVEAMKSLYSVALGLVLIWLALSQLSGQETTATLVHFPATLANTPHPLMSTSFTQTAKLIASKPITVDSFGRVAIDGDTIVVGAGNAAYVFVKPSNRSWPQQHERCSLYFC